MADTARECACADCFALAVFFGVTGYRGDGGLGCRVIGYMGYGGVGFSWGLGFGAYRGIWGHRNCRENNVVCGDFVGLWLLGLRVRLAFSDRVFRVWVLGWKGLPFLSPCNWTSRKMRCSPCQGAGVLVEKEEMAEP